MIEMTPQLVISLVTAAATIGGTVGAVRVTLNGTAKRVQDIDKKLDSHMTEVRENRTKTLQRLTRVETLIGKINGD